MSTPAQIDYPTTRNSLPAHVIDRVHEYIQPKRGNIVSSEKSSLSVNELIDKVSSDKLIEAISNNETKHNFAFASDFVLAIKMSKQRTIETFIKTLQSSGFNVVSLGSNIVIASGIDIYCEARLFQRTKYCTLYCRFWCPDVKTKKEFEVWANNIFTDKLIKGTICGLRWAYASKHGLATTYIEELLSDVVLEESYPSIVREYGSLDNFVESYLESDESVLVLQGPPGTGKSRLIRYLMAKLVELKNVDKDFPEDYDFASSRSKSLVLYTSDSESLKGDELFATFMTSDEVMFIVEDADNMLRSRSSGNDHLHRFLTVSDGIIRNVGRKVVFTTNLPNMNDIDDALIRVGRCFSAISLGGLNATEAISIAEKLSNGDKKVVGSVVNHFKQNKMMTLAEVYKVWKSPNR